ncbi:MAG: 3-deoxy-manno-octulosonate cytidylyltransferase [Pyrinomonadaceae bacterium]
MEHHGENPLNNVIAIIPARYASVRLPGKMLLPIAGRPLILHTVEQVKAATNVDRVVVATDDERIFNAVRESGNEAVLTRADHSSGSDRIAEVAEPLPEGSIIVNVQGDEPLISPETIDAAVGAMLQGDSDIVTVCEPLTSLHDELLNFNVVKVVFTEDRRALYFSRSPMPFPRDASLRHGGDPNRALENEPKLFEHFRKHVGLYVYSREYLLQFTKLPQTRLEKFESLEQLRALENRATIRVVDAVGTSIGVDTREDFERAKDIIEACIDIRKANREELPRVAKVHVDSWQRSFAGIAPKAFLANISVEKRLAAYRERRCDENYEMMVADHTDAGIIGFADFGTPRLPGDFDAQIFSFYFLPEYQRRGYGERLFRRCVARMAEKGITSLCLDSLEVSPYRAFYDKMGGKIVGHDSHKLGDKDFATVIYGWDDISKI